LEDCKRGNVKYIYLHTVLGKRDSFPREDGCNWVKIMYKGGFGVSNSEGLVYVTRQTFHLMTQIQIQYENKYLIVHSYLLHLQKTSYIAYKGQKKVHLYITRKQ
jgi:hypothetical protein